LLQENQRLVLNLCLQINAHSNTRPPQSTEENELHGVRTGPTGCVSSQSLC
jgi:hypothetical protein